MLSTFFCILSSSLPVIPSFHHSIIPIFLVSRYSSLVTSFTLGTYESQLFHHRVMKNRSELLDLVVVPFRMHSVRE
jgi:hypothetical protein